MSLSQHELIEALKGLSPEQLQGILGQGYGRSPIKPRQLHDLRLKPTATDPRPTFCVVDEAPRDALITHSPYPKLLWHTETGAEITVWSAEEEATKTPRYTDVSPILSPVTEAERLKAEFEALSPEDQAFVLEIQAQARKTALQQKFGGAPAFVEKGRKKKGD